MTLSESTLFKLKAYTTNSPHIMSPSRFSDTWDYDDDFTGADNWVDADTTIGVNTTNNQLDFTFVRDGTNDRSVHDLTAISDTAFVSRFHQFNFSSITTINCFGYFGFSSGDESVGQTTSQDAILSIIRDNGSLNKLGLISADGAAVGTTENPTSFTLATSTDYYAELTRLSSTTTRSRFGTNSDFTTGVTEISDTIASTVQGLRYMTLFNFLSATAGSVIGTLERVQFIDGVTTAP